MALMAAAARSSHRVSISAAAHRGAAGVMALGGVSAQLCLA